MERRRVLGLSIAVLILLLLAAVSGTPSLAQEPGGLSFGLQVNPDGSWQVVELFGQQTNLDPRSFNSMAQAFGLGFQVPAKLDPAIISQVMQADISQVTLSLEGEVARVRLDDLASPQAKVHLPNLDFVMGGSFQEAYGFVVQVLKFVRGSVYVRFGPEAIAAAAPAEAAEVETANSVQLAATVNSEGRLLSAGGFTRQEVDPVLSSMGLMLTDLPASVMAYLGPVDEVAAEVTPSQVTVYANQAPVVEVIWDEAGRQAVVDIVERVTGVPVDGAVVEMVEPWLQSTEAEVKLHVAESPQDELMAVEVGEPIAVALAEDGLNVAGMRMPVAGVDMGLIRQTVDAYGVESAQLCWEGTALRWLVNGKPLPYVTADAGWLTKAIELLGWQTFSIHEKAEALLAETELPVAVALERGAVPTDGCGAYEVAEAGRPALAFGVQGTWDRQRSEIALDEVDLPFGALGLLPLGISAQVQLPEVAAVFVPPSLGRVEASLGANGLTADVDDVDVRLHWDSQLLSNLAEVTDPLGVGPTIRQLVPVLRMAEVNVDIERVEEITAVSEAVPQEEATAIAAASSAELTGEGESQAASVAESQAEVSAGGPKSLTCVLSEGESLWTCWVDQGRSEGTGRVWVDWKNAIMDAYGLTVNEEGIVVVQPGDTIDFTTSPN